MNKQENHTIITVEESDSSVAFYNAADGSELARIQVGFWPHEIAISKDGSTAFVSNFGLKDYDERIGSPGGSISVIDIQNMCEVDRLYTFSNFREAAEHRAPHGVQLSPSGRKLFVNVEKKDKLLIFDLSDKEISCPKHIVGLETSPRAVDNLPDDIAEVPIGTHNFLFSPKGSKLWVAAGRSGLMRYEVDPESELPSNPDYPHWPHSSVRGLSYSNDDKFLIASCADEVFILAPESDNWQVPIRRLNNLGRGFGTTQFLYSACAPDGKHLLAPAVWESVVVVIDMITGEEISRISVGIDPIHVHIAPNRQSAYVTHGRSQFLLELDLSSENAKEWNVKRKINTRGGPNGISTTAFSPYIKRESLVFGSALPLSGPNSTEGRELRMGYEFWKEKTNQAGGIVVDGKPHFVETIYLDTQSDNDIAGALTKALIKGNKESKRPPVEFLLGNYPTPANLKTAEVANAQQVPFVTSSGAGSLIYQQGWEYVFGIMSPARLYLAGTINVAIQKISTPNPTIAFLSCEDPAALEDAVTTAVYAIKNGFRFISYDFLDDLPDELKEIFVLHEEERQGINVQLIKYAHNLTDFEHFMRTFKVNGEPDLFLHTGHLQEGRSLIASAAIVDFLPRGMGLSVGPALSSFRRAMERGRISGDYLFGAAQWTKEVPVIGHDRFISPATFADAFFERFSMEVSYLGAGAYTCGTVFEAAFRAARSSDSKRVRDALAQTSLRTFYAEITLTDEGDITHPPRLNHQKPMYTIQLKQNAPGNWNLNIVWPPQSAIWPLPGWSQDD